ncbi:hypothetical protein [Pseudoalteromonas denitrificans]|uniref:Uncharacterized protein n=1 Tax=Pseudoalteromonas denitrificans DSM 6059 TaxID=1123010 RepID=A0A1I1QQR6_9GAMM|nr:hypothetical protein [Pseudoalteromonas denitrificans]SFD24466.1 hypothetical protein SAMN02745724_03976 [Pseudoalteromonas denitrificans DSM 6059]
MSTKIKQQKLLKPEDFNKKTKKRSKATTKSYENTKIPNAQHIVKVEKKSNKTLHLVIFLLLLVIIYFVSPKPSLLTYEKSGIVNQSIYWPGFYTIEPFILDSNLKADASITANHLFLCHKNLKKIQCQKYKIIDEKGVFSVILHYYNTYQK